MWLIFFTINTICRGEKITDLCHGSENKNPFIYVYQKFTKCPAFGIFKIHIRTLQKHTSWEGLRDVKYCFTESRNRDTCKHGYESDGSVMHDEGGKNKRHSSWYSLSKSKQNLTMNARIPDTTGYNWVSFPFLHISFPINMYSTAIFFFFLNSQLIHFGKWLKWASLCYLEESI